MPVDPKTIQEDHGVMPFRSSHLRQTTAFCVTVVIGFWITWMAQLS